MKFAVSHFTGKPRAYKPREFEGWPSMRRQAANLSAKNIMIWLYAIAQSRAGIGHFFDISFQRNMLLLCGFAIYSGDTI